MPDPTPPPVTAAVPAPAGDYASGALFRRFWRGYLHPHLGWLALAMLLMVVEGSTLGLLSWTLEPLFDRVFTSGGAEALPWVGTAILLLFLTRAVTSILAKGLLARIAQKSAADMQADLLAHLLTLDGGFFQTNPPGTLIERVQGDTLAAQSSWQAVLTGTARDLVALVGLFAVALMIDPVWTLAALVGAPLLLLPALTLQRYIRRKTMQSRENAGLRATRLDEIFHGIQQVKLNRLEAYQTGRFRRILDSIVGAEVKSAFGRATMPALIDIVTGIGFFAVLMLGGAQVVAGTRTTGEFMSFFTAMALTFQPIRRLGDLSGQWQVAAASLERIYRLFDSRPVSRRPATSAALPPSGAPEIALREVVFAYDDTPVLAGLTFTAPAGRTTALVGASGAGKSTVFHLLTGLVEPQAGDVRIGGVRAQDMTLADQRALFASVTQDAALFDETLRENLTLGRDLPDTALADALRAAHLDAFVGGLPAGLATPAGPRGSALSGGQRQRVAIARALLRDAPVLLLDEATSALDAQSEAQVAAALDRLSTGRTTLVIAHRLATVRSAHHIVVMDRGRVAEEGTHDSLLARGGLYARLHDLQFRA